MLRLVISLVLVFSAFYGTAQQYQSSTFEGYLDKLRISGTIEYKPDCKLGTAFVRATLKDVKVIGYSSESNGFISGQHNGTPLSFPIIVDDGYLDITADLGLYRTGYKNALETKKAHLSLWNSGKGNAFMADDFRFPSNEEDYITERIADNCTDLKNSFYANGRLENIEIIGGFLEIDNGDVEDYILKRIKAQEKEEATAEKSEEDGVQSESSASTGSNLYQRKVSSPASPKRKSYQDPNEIYKATASEIFDMLAEESGDRRLSKVANNVREIRKYAAQFERMNPELAKNIDEIENYSLLAGILGPFILEESQKQREAVAKRQRELQQIRNHDQRIIDFEKEILIDVMTVKENMLKQYQKGNIEQFKKYYQAYLTLLNTPISLYNPELLLLNFYADHPNARNWQVQAQNRKIKTDPNRGVNDMQLSLSDQKKDDSFQVQMKSSLSENNTNQNLKSNALNTDFQKAEQFTQTQKSENMANNIHEANFKNYPLNTTVGKIYYGSPYVTAKKVLDELLYMTFTEAPNNDIISLLEDYPLYEDDHFDYQPYLLALNRASETNNKVLLEKVWKLIDNSYRDTKFDLYELETHERRGQQRKYLNDKTLLSRKTVTVNGRKSLFNALTYSILKLRYDFIKEGELNTKYGYDNILNTYTTLSYKKVLGDNPKFNLSKRNKFYLHQLLMENLYNQQEYAIKAKDKKLFLSYMRPAMRISNTYIKETDASNVKEKNNYFRPTYHNKVDVTYFSGMDFLRHAKGVATYQASLGLGNGPYSNKAFAQDSKLIVGRMKWTNAWARYFRTGSKELFETYIEKNRHNPYVAFEWLISYGKTIKDDTDITADVN